MTITTIYEPQVEAYTGLGPYGVGFESIGADAFEVWAVDSTNARTYIPPADYTVTFTGSSPIFDGGEVTLTQAAPADTVALSLERNTPITQLVDFQAYGRFGANIVEFALDKGYMIMQELASKKCNNVVQTP